jgi:hypothetical protein
VIQIKPVARAGDRLPGHCARAGSTRLAAPALLWLNAWMARRFAWKQWE